MTKKTVSLICLTLILFACTPVDHTPQLVEPTSTAELPSPTPLPTKPSSSTPLPTFTLPPPTPTTSPALRRPDPPQIGLNFIRFYLDQLPHGEPNQRTPYLQPDWIFQDFTDLGIHAYRQFVRADLLWDIVEPQDDQWYFDEADTVIPNPDFEPIVTLFAMQYASATPPWETDPARFQKTLGPEAEEYLAQIIARYGEYVKYWELGNEMEHWRASDPDAPPVEGVRSPDVVPPAGFSPQEQGAFLAQAAAFIRARDPDAIIVMPGMGGLDDYTINTWLAGIIEGGGAAWFDVINYHYYPSWESFCDQRGQLQAFLEQHSLTDKPVWLTETGSTASESLNRRTNYPNSYTSQAADIFRRIIPAYGQGDDLVFWHTYIDSVDAPTNNWRLYGVRSDQGEAYPSYYALQLLVQELLPFAQVEMLACDPRAINAYRVTTQAGDVRYVAWGTGAYLIPDGVTQLTTVIPDTSGNYTWQVVRSGETIPLASEPLLLK